MKTYCVPGHAPSLLPEGHNFKLLWSDEFDGSKIDTDKWDYRLCMMGKRYTSWTDKGVEVRDGCAVFSISEENGEIVCSQLQTGYNFMDQPAEKTTFGNDHLQWQIGRLQKSKFLHRYGYYECRCRLQQKLGWWSAFWMQSPIIGASLEPKKTGSEVDIMECFKPNVIAPHNVFTGGYGLDMQRRYTGGMSFNGPTDEFHTFGLLWLPDRYVFYVHGREDGTITENVSATEEFLLISTETMGYRHEGHRPTAEAIATAKTGDDFLVDHVRVFDISRS